MLTFWVSYVLLSGGFLVLTGCLLDAGGVNVFLVASLATTIGLITGEVTRFVSRDRTAHAIFPRSPSGYTKCVAVATATVLIFTVTSGELLGWDMGVFAFLMCALFLLGFIVRTRMLAESLVVLGAIAASLGSFASLFIYGVVLDLLGI